MAEQILNDWQTVVSLLPPNWEQLADEHKQVQTQFGNAKITNAGELLRLILVHAAADLPLRQTVALVAQSGGPDISPMRLHKKMARAADYLHALVLGLVGRPEEMSPEKWSGYDVSVVDATVISQPGSVNGDARIHTRMRLASLEYVEVFTTGIDVGESFRRFIPARNELIVADRGYCNARGVAHVVDAGADVLVRFNRTSMPVTLADGKTPLALLPLLRSLSSRVHERFVCVLIKDGDETRLIHGRLCMQRLPERQAQEARKRARKEYGSDVSADTLEAAGYVVLFTTVPVQRLSAKQCMDLYRLRWQIELAFKRWKSLCGFDRMPNHKPETILAWVYAKILAAVLLERLASTPGEVSPPIQREWFEQPDDQAAVEDDPLALAALRLRTAADDALRCAALRRKYH